jgi:phosphate transport system protein
VRLFAQVREALARATWALLNDDVVLGQEVVDGDDATDLDCHSAESFLWDQVGATTDLVEIRRLVTFIVLASELERSADLAVHIARRAVQGVGRGMSPTSRGIVQRMFEVASEMWANAAGMLDHPHALDLAETDEELDILRDRLMHEVARGDLEPGLASQVTLLARFYERLGDHAVNIGRRLTEAG